ncbi:hypothetical protein B0H21DRAFT_703417 [Amylocystis lapponica]|nr:hypothetical protein B0H21DRAFT_703417 [Amylocystis lapponica]
MQHPDEPLPSLQLSLAEFNQRAYDATFSNRPTSNLDSVRFILAGRTPPHHSPAARVFLNVRQELPDLAMHGYTVTRDYDSVIGITRTLPFTQAISVYPVPPFSATLTKDIHIEVAVAQPLVSTNQSVQVPLHKIPNICFAKLGVRGQSRLFFPALYSKDRSPKISQVLLRKYYDQFLRPTVDTICYSLAHWPVTYTSALSLSHDRVGAIHPGTVDIPAADLPAFTDHLLALLDLDPDFKGAFWQHEVRGVKGATPHAPSDPLARDEALDLAIHPMDRALLDFTEWHVDVAIEIAKPDSSLVWLTSLELPFTRVQVRRADATAWKVNFDKLFPPKGFVRTTATQNFGSSLYYKRWNMLLSHLSSAHATTARLQIERRFNTLMWMPSGSDRIWVTTQNRGKAWTRYPRGSTGPAPQIIINTRFSGAVTLRDPLLAEEDE